MARPPKLDTERRGKFCALVALGLTVVEAARCVGVTDGAIRKAAQRDRDFRRQVWDARAAWDHSQLAEFSQSARLAVRLALERLEARRRGPLTHEQLDRRDDLRRRFRTTVARPASTGARENNSRASSNHEQRQERE